MRYGWVWCVIVCLTAGVASAASVAKAPGVSVKYDGISQAQADALAATISAARDIYLKDFAADMPPMITLNVTCAAGQPTRLYNDGKDQVFLSIASPAALALPSKSGAFHLYGLCHEVGHLAMYRVLRDRDWMTTGAAEGWAHYAGSMVVDGVYAAKGEKLWPDPYDYRADGVARLTRQLAAKSTDEVTRGAGQWQALEAIVGKAAFAKAFTAIQAAEVDPAEPAAKLLPALVTVAPDKSDELKKWYASAEPLLVQPRPKSGFKRVEIAVAKLEAKPLAIAEDDNAPDGKRSIAGGGHARLFKAPPGGEWYVRSVSIHGARYGPAAAPADTFDVALCDADMHPIAIWKQPYKSFDRGAPKWVRLDVPPTLVPATFHICAVFRPTAQNGVFVSTDTSTGGNSHVATPGAAGEPLKQGDWMIRVELDRPKAADALRGQ